MIESALYWTFHPLGRSTLLRAPPVIEPPEVASTMV
jgi:hypothetical protein